MEIEPISSSTPTTDLWLDLWAQRMQARSKDAEQQEDGEAPPFQPSAPPGDGTDVEIDEDDGSGAQTVRPVEAESGPVISRIPPQQVLDLVTSLIEQNQLNEEGGVTDGQH